MTNDADSRIDLTATPFSLDADGVEWVESTLARMSDEQLVGQLLCVYLRSEDMSAWRSWLARHRIEPGGFMMLMRDADSARAHVSELQRHAAVPMLAAGNLESGAVNFLSDTEAFANPMQVAATGDISQVEVLAEHCVGIAKQIGLNWAFAPVVDVVVNTANPITNTRAFSSDVETVASFGETYVRYLEARSIATSPKHFPGDGVDGRDQHLVTVNNDLDEQSWWSTFGAVYERIIASGARTIMAAHIRQPALSRAEVPGIEDRDLQPASLAPELLQGVLRGKLGFNGMIVSDNSAMTGFTALYPRAEGVTRAVNAGIDMLLGNLDVVDDFTILLSALTDGRIPRSRGEEAVRRILATKASIGLHRGVSEPDALVIGDAEGARRRDRLAAKSITLVKDTQGLLPLTPDAHRRVLVYVLGDQPTFYDPSAPLAPQFVAGLEERGLQVEVRAVPGNATTPASAERLHEDFDLCIYFADVRFAGNTNGLRVVWSPPQGPDAPRHVASLPTVLVSVADPYLMQDMPMIKTALNGYTPTPSTVRAMLAALFGEQPITGVSPVDPFAGQWDAAL